MHPQVPYMRATAAGGSWRVGRPSPTVPRLINAGGGAVYLCAGVRAGIMRCTAGCLLSGLQCCAVKKFAGKRLRKTAEY